MALAATSATIALSIGSAFPDTRDASSSGATVQARDTGWKTAYDAIRMAVETIKESSDMFLPLKAVVGAVSVLMKNYDVSVSCLQTEDILILACFPFQQTSDNVEGLKGIKQRVQLLSGILASPVSEDDYAEKERRVELRRSVPSCTILISSLTPLSGYFVGSSQSLNHSLNNMRSFGSCTMSRMPRC